MAAQIEPSPKSQNQKVKKDELTIKNRTRKRWTDHTECKSDLGFISLNCDDDDDDDDLKLFIMI